MKEIRTFASPEDIDKFFAAAERLGIEMDENTEVWFGFIKILNTIIDRIEKIEEFVAWHSQDDI
jgi:hypothetical protein